MKQICTTTAEAQQVSENDSGMFARLLSEQPPEGYDVDGFVDDEVVFCDRSRYDSDIVIISLKYPSGYYVMYAPKRTVCHSKATSEEEVFTVPTKTNIKLSVVTTVKRVQELTYEELVSTRHVGLTGFIYTNPWVELNAWTKGVVG